MNQSFPSAEGPTGEEHRELAIGIDQTLSARSATPVSSSLSSSPSATRQIEVIDGGVIESEAASSRLLRDRAQVEIQQADIGISEIELNEIQFVSCESREEESFSDATFASAEELIAGSNPSIVRDLNGGVGELSANDLSSVDEVSDADAEEIGSNAHMLSASGNHLHIAIDTEPLERTEIKDETFNVDFEISAESERVPVSIEESDAADTDARLGEIEGDVQWELCHSHLRALLDSQIFVAWIRPLIFKSIEIEPAAANTGNSVIITLAASNRFSRDHVERHYRAVLCQVWAEQLDYPVERISLRIVTETIDTLNRGGAELAEDAAGSLRIPGKQLPQQGKATGRRPHISEITSGDGNVRVPGDGLLRSQPGSKTGKSIGNTDDALEILRSSETETGETLGAAASRALPKKSVSTPRASEGSQPSPRDGSNLNPKYNFSNFVVGGCNQFAHAVSLRVAENLGTSYNPLFIYGGVGLGKTHLANAIGNACRRRSKKVLLVSSELFVNELISSLRSNRMHQFKERFRSIDLLVIDDVQFLIGKERTQEEFFHTFNELYHHHKQIVLTSDKVPQELVGLEERLRTRFASGLSVDLQVPDFETRVAILSKKAEASGIDIPDVVARLLAQRIDTNVRELEGALNRLHALSSLHAVPIDQELAEEVLKSVAPLKKREVTAELIQRVVAECFNVGISDIIGKRRTHNIAFARQVAMYLCRRLTGRSFPEIGALFGGRDHSTVIHAHRSITEKISADPAFQEEIKLIERRLFE